MSVQNLFRRVSAIALAIMFLATAETAKSTTLSTDILDFADSRPNAELGFGLLNSVEWIVGVRSLQVTNTKGEKEAGLDVNTGLAFYLRGMYSRTPYMRYSAYVARTQKDEEASRIYKGPIWWSVGYSWQFGNRLRLKLGIIPGFFTRSGDFHRTLGHNRHDTDGDGVVSSGEARHTDRSDFELRLGWWL